MEMRLYRRISFFVCLDVGQICAYKKAPEDFISINPRELLCVNYLLSVKN